MTTAELEKLERSYVMKDRDIMKVVQLIRGLERPDCDIDVKIEMIKMYQSMGYITANEAIDLAVEYSG